MLHLKDNTVEVEGLKQQMYFALGIADAAFGERGKECVITAALDSKHNPGSLHGQGLAVDLRNDDLNPYDYSLVLFALKRLEKYGFDVVAEKAGQTAKTTAQHFHIEYQPKPGERTSLFG